MPQYAGLIAALASVAGAGAGIYGAVTAGGDRPSGVPTAPTDTTAAARSILPGARADLAARTGGGISPEFIANLIGQQTGQPGAGLDILEEIRRGGGF